MLLLTACGGGGSTNSTSRSNTTLTNGGSNNTATSPAGKITEFPVTSAKNLQAITAGPDGNLWFTDIDGNQIGRITPSGTVTTFALPTPGSRPGEITVGPDHNLWFTETKGDRIGRITPSGTITEFPITTSGGLPTFWMTGSVASLPVAPSPSFQKMVATPPGLLPGRMAICGLPKIGEVRLGALPPPEPSLIFQYRWLLLIAVL